MILSVALFVKTIEFFDGNSWRQVDSIARRGRAVFGGGWSPNITNVIDYITISTLGNAIDFGDLTYNSGFISKYGFRICWFNYYVATYKT